MPAEVVGALIAIGGMFFGSVVTALVTMRVEATRQKAENSRHAETLAAERQRLELDFAHQSRMRQLEWRRGDRKIVIDRARSFLDEVSAVVQQIGVFRASQAVSGEPKEDKVSLWVGRMADVLNRHGGVWLSVPDAELGPLLRDLAIAPMYPGWMPSNEYEAQITGAYRRLEQVAALLDEP